MNQPPIIFYNRSCLDKKDHYTPDLLPSAVFVASENCVITLTTPYDYPQLLHLTFDDPNPIHAMNIYKPYCVRGENRILI